MENQIVTLGIVYWYCCRGPCYYIYQIPLDDLSPSDIRMLSLATMDPDNAWPTELSGFVNDMLGGKYERLHFSNHFFRPNSEFEYDTDYLGKNNYIHCTYRLSRRLC